MKKNTQYLVRQGDVLIVRLDQDQPIPLNAKRVKRDNGRCILAYGEVTGHTHVVTGPAELYDADRKGVRHLRVGAEGAEVRHEEHATIALPAGDYRVEIQREWTPAAVVNVAD